MPTQLSRRATAGRHCPGGCKKPKILLADDPTGNPGPQLARSIMKLFSQFNELGTR
ncbi:MAG: hypothetical protein CM15mP120_07690 [Pseudomonadota bacterium]|nr:MAG: hypothetical protein CM15mP120_07690 [Pseudomonadota bacterium]